MKRFTYILVVALAFALGLYVSPSKGTYMEVRTDTVFSTSVIIRRDTIRHYLPSPVLCWHNGDTIHVGDTVLPVEHKIYRDSGYVAYVSGYRPNLDSINVYSSTVTVTNDVYHTVKGKTGRWGIGITAGYGFGKEGLSPAIIAGISYRIW